MAKYRVLESFPYKGVTGKKREAVTVGPGEECPILDAGYRDHLIASGKIAETDSDGANIIRKKEVEIKNTDELERFLQRDRMAIKTDLRRLPLSTKSKIGLLKMAEKMSKEKGLPEHILKDIEDSI